MSDETELTEAEAEAQQIRRNEIAIKLEQSVADSPVTFRFLEMISKTEFVPSSLRGKPWAMAAAVKTGAELGLGPMTSMRSIDVIDGNPTPSAELLNAMIRGAGHMLQPLEITDTVVSIRAARRDDPEHPFVVTEEFVFTLSFADFDEVIQGGKPINQKKVWKEYPKAMLWARCVTWAGRVMFPDITLKVNYTMEELDPSLDDIHPPDPDAAMSYELDENGELVAVGPEVVDHSSSEGLRAGDDVDEADVVCDVKGCEADMPHTNTAGIVDYLNREPDPDWKNPFGDPDPDATPEPDTSGDPKPGDFCHECGRRNEQPHKPECSQRPFVSGEESGTSTTSSEDPETSEASTEAPTEPADPTDIDGAAKAAVADLFPNLTDEDIEGLWSELYTELIPSPNPPWLSGGTIPVIKTKVKRIFELMSGPLQMWPNGAYRAACVRFSEQDRAVRNDDKLEKPVVSISRFRTKPHMQRFAARVIQWTQEALDEREGDQPE